MNPISRNSRRSGFTLLEVVIAIGLMAVVIAMVFATARTSLACSEPC